MDILSCGENLLTLSDIFTRDAESRGIYIPPTMLQAMAHDGSIKETIVLNPDGSSTVHQGGAPGIPPGAPGAFVKARQEANVKLFEKPQHSKNADVEVGMAPVSNDTPSKTSSKLQYPVGFKNFI
jgi:hypothetical protein